MSVGGSRCMGFFMAPHGERCRGSLSLGKLGWGLKSTLVLLHLVQYFRILLYKGTQFCREIPRVYSELSSSPNNTSDFFPMRLLKSRDRCGEVCRRTELSRRAQHTGSAMAWGSMSLAYFTCQRSHGVSLRNVWVHSGATGLSRSFSNPYR